MHTVIQLQGVTKVYPGRMPSLRGTKLEMQGPALWIRNAWQAMRPTAATTPSVVALSECTIAVGQGEIFGVLGQNGSGKTTLIKIIAGLIRPTRGTGQVAGVPLGETAHIRRRVSYVSTTGWMGLEWALTAEENLRFFARLSGLTERVAKMRTEEALMSLDLVGDRQKLVSQLSNGMRQRVIMDRALLWRTPVVLLDEPLVGLDPHHRQALIQVIEKLARERGQTVVVADHDAKAVSALAHRVLVLSQGRVAQMGTVAEIVATFRDRRVVECVTRGSVDADAELPMAVTRVERRPIPGPLPESRWQVVVRGDRPGALMDVMGWMEAQGLTILELTERAPSLQDVLSEESGSLGGRVTA